MSSRPRHLDASGDREVVFCHICNNEWYKDEDDDALICPSCHSEATEIVSLENDPRTMHDGPPDGREAPPIPPHPYRYRDDDDPDEADIDDFRYPQGGGGLLGRRTVFRGPERFPPPSTGFQSRTNPSNGDDIIRSFTELLGDIGGPPGRTGGLSQTFTTGPRRVTYQRITGPNFTGGVSSITITGPGNRQGGGTAPGALAGGDAEFQRIFGDIFRGPPTEQGMADDEARRAQAEANRPLDLATALNQLFANLLNPHGTYGDGVYTQEALDRIITNLMETNPQSNAAAPASNEAIDSLERKPLDREMLDGEDKGECTICIDEMNLGDQATVLPCRHWFHEDCVVLWLREHNTCPICRAPIDGTNAGQPQTSASTGADTAANTGIGTASASSPGSGGSQAPNVPPDSTRPTWVQFSGSESRQSGADAAMRRRTLLHENAAARLDALRQVGERQTYQSFGQQARQQQQQQQQPPQQEPGQRRQSGGSGGGSGGGGPFNWLRNQFGRDGRS